MQYRDRELIERTDTRWLLVFFDFLMFLFVFVYLYFIDPARISDPETGGRLSAVLVFLLSFVCIFIPRSLFKVYKQVLRYGNVRAFARLLAADVLGGGALLLLHALLLGSGGASLFQAGVFVTVDLILCLGFRILYFYLYKLAQKDTGFGRWVRSALRFFFGVDMDSAEPGAVCAPFSVSTSSTEPINQVQRVAREFLIRGEIKEIVQMKAGYINRTYRVDTVSEDGTKHAYTLQRINTNVFRDVDALMSNFVLVTTHLKDRQFLSGQRETGCVNQAVQTVSGEDFFHDDSGFWRMTTHFMDVFSLDIPDSPETFYEAGRAYGGFLREMSDVPVEQIQYTIPNFHDTGSRYEDLEKAIQSDRYKRVRESVSEIEFVRNRKEEFNRISDALAKGEIPLRICHNDCNLNNLLFDNTTHLPVAVIDLDTVMPSSPLYDFGDSMRVGTNTARDDEKDLRKVSCDLNLYEQYARGYLEACGKMLTEKELELLPYAAFIITMEDGIRFLTDHINGDTYYHIYYSGQNMDRARTQLKLAEDMERKLPQIREILSKIYREQGLIRE